MKTIKGTWTNGHVVLDDPVRWPEGTRVRIEALGVSHGNSDDDQDDDPESIAKWIAEFDAIPPWEMTPEEETRWQADRQAVKDYTIAKSKQRFGEDQP